MAAKSICEWVRAVSEFTVVWKKIETMKTNVEGKNKELRAANKKLRAKQKELH